MDTSYEEENSESACDPEFTIKPYSFEPTQKQKESILPEISDSESTSGPEEENENVENWCKCTNCSELPGEDVFLCCHNYTAMKERLNEKDEENAKFNCITQHPGFQSNCLDRYVFEASYYEFCQNQGEPGDDEPLHETLRYISYRRMVRWIFKKLGAKNRKRLPACAVKAIRANFPSDSGQ